MAVSPAPPRVQMKARRAKGVAITGRQEEDPGATEAQAFLVTAVQVATEGVALCQTFSRRTIAHRWEIRGWEREEEQNQITRLRG